MFAFILKTLLFSASLCFVCPKQYSWLKKRLGQVHGLVVGKTSLCLKAFLIRFSVVWKDAARRVLLPALLLAMHVTSFTLIFQIYVLPLHIA